MATPAEKLAASLVVLRQLQELGVVAIKTNALSRTHRERLLENGFIKQVYQGWYRMVSPQETKGDSTSWYSSYWNFCAQHLEDKYGTNWCLSAEQSLLLNVGNWKVPQQLIVKSPEAANFRTELPFHTSLFHIKSQLPAKNEIIVKDGVRLLSLEAALIQSSPNAFIQNPVDVRTALTLIKDASQLLALLLDGGNSIVAGRLAGAFRNIAQDRIASDILKSMKKAGYDVRETDPFNDKVSITLSNRIQSPYENRIRLIWDQMRQTVMKHFPEAPGIPKNKTKYLKLIKEVYVTDAYHSLSIEKYQVTPALIERVRSGNWDFKDNEGDRQQRDAMAAKGYWEAFQAVERSVKRVIEGENAGEVLDDDHGEWYRELFGPSVAAGLLKPSDLAGYRNQQVFIGQSKHVPLNKEAVRDAMPILFELLHHESEASVKAVLGHFIFVYIHPYMDGNGRMGRFIMNLMLAAGGYPWTVIPVEERKAYMHALEQASVNQNIEPFALFVGNLVAQGIKGKPVAKI